MLADGILHAKAFLVQGCNSRFWGLIGENAGWYTNVELAERWSSIVTPIGWAFAIWGLIYCYELALLVYLFVAPEDFVDLWQNAWYWWVAGNLCQAVWAPLFATQQMLSSSFALTGIAVALIALGVALRKASGTSYALVAAPIWLHAGW